MISRRDFFKTMLAAAAAPAIVRADSLMRIIVPTSAILTLYGDGIHDDTAALQALINGSIVHYGSEILQARDGNISLPTADFKISDTFLISGNCNIEGNHTTLLGPAERQILEFSSGSIKSSVKNLHLVWDSPPLWVQRVFKS